jgi:hypothetical protein
VSGPLPIRIFKYGVLLVLLVLVGLPLWAYEKVVGHQPERLVDALDRLLA